MTPRVDIICLVHNNISITRGFVKSLFANTDNFHLIFINNGSTDGTLEFLNQGEQDQKWEVINPGTNLGVIHGRNLGVKHIKSDFFINIDNDQYPGPGWLSGLFDLINQGYDIVGPEAWELTPPNASGVVNIKNTNMNRGYFPIKHCARITDKFSYIGCGGMLVKKKVYDKIGLFDEQFSPAYFEDPDFCFRAILAGFKLGWKQDCNITHLAHQTFDNQTLFQKNDQFIKSWIKFKNKWKVYFPNPMVMI